MIKSDPVLASFVRYCINHPHERFWQALRNWSGQPAILTGKSVAVMSGSAYQIDQDTFYWEGKNG